MTPRLLMVTDDFVCGGAFMVGARLARGLVRDYRVVFACDISPVNRALRGELALVGVEVVGLFAHAGDTRRARYDLSGACALLRLAKPDKILFVDSSPRSNLAVKDAAREGGVPYVSIINFVDKETPLALKVFDADVERAANAAVAVVFVSAAARAEFEANFAGVDAPRFVVSNGVPDVFFEPVAPLARHALRRELELDDDEVMLLLAGRLEPRKGQDLALSALALLATCDGPRLRLFLAGFGETAEIRALAERVRALTLERHVRYLGVREDLPLLIDACDIVLMPSEQEADGLVAKEAMARGRPVIASDLPGVREQGHRDEMLIPAPGNGPEHTVRALAITIDALRRDPSRLAEIGSSLRAVAQRRFTMTQMISAYREILDTLPARRRARSAPALKLGRWLTWPHEAAGLFKDGWSEVEHDGIWSVGVHSRIAFSLPRWMRQAKISMRVWTFAAPDRERRFEVFANARQVATWIFSDQSEVVREIRVSIPAARPLLVLRFCHANPSSPYQLGLNQDRRPLGLFVFALRLDSADSMPRRLALLSARVAPMNWKTRVVPLRTIDFGDLGLGDVMMAWAGLYALLMEGLRPLAPGCRLYVPRELADLAAALFAKYDVVTEGVRPFHPRQLTSPVLTASPPDTVTEWWSTFAGPDWRMNAFAALDTQKTIPLRNAPIPARDKLRLYLTERVFYKRLGWRAAVPEYLGFRLCRPLAQRLGLPPAQFLTLIKRSLPRLRAEVRAYVELRTRLRAPVPRFAIFPVGKAFQSFPPAVCRQIRNRLPRGEAAFFIPMDDPWIDEYRAAGIEPRALDSVEDLYTTIATAPHVLTTDSFASHVAQALRDDFVLALTRDIRENVVHPGATPRLLVRHPACAPCAYLARYDSRLCSAGHANCLAFDDAEFAVSLAEALAAP